MSISVQHWKAALNGIGDAVSLLDGQGRILWYNDAMRRLVREQPDDPVENVACSELLKGVSSCHGSACPFTLMIEGRKRISETVSLGERWFRVIVDPLFDENSEISGAVHIMEDVTEHKLSEELRDERMRLVSLGAEVGFALNSF